MDQEINNIIKDKAKQLEMGKKATEISINNVEEKIFDEIKKVLQ